MKSIGMMVLLVGSIVLTGCSDSGKTAGESSNGSSLLKSTGISQTEKDAQYYFSQMRPLSDEYQSIYSEFQNFDSQLNSGGYTPTSAINEMINIETELDNIRTENIKVDVPSDMGSNNDLFLRSIADMLSADKEVQNAELADVPASTEQSFSNANKLMDQSVSEMKQFLTNMHQSTNGDSAAS